MCNPPFYTSTEEATQAAAAKELLPNAVRSLVPSVPKQYLKYHILLGLHWRGR